MLLALFLSLLANAGCSPQLPSESLTGSGSVSRDLEDLKLKFETLYESGKRLKHRAHEESSALVADYHGKTVRIPPSFISQLKTQAELMLERGYADHLFYSDLGHGHLLLPEEEEAGDLEKALASPRLKILYHTAELLEMRKGGFGPLPTDPALAWRYFSRNLLASGKDLAVLFAHGKPYNTVSAIPGYRQVSTFYISASKNGCLPYRQDGKTFYFDLSLQR